MLSRGGISVGELHHQKGIVYGPALLTAHQLESQSAIYPRIVLEKDALVKSLQVKGVPQDCEELIRNQLRTDSDGWEHVHIMGHQAMIPFHEMLPSSKPQVDGPLCFKALIKAKVAATRSALKKNPPEDIRSVSKHKWMHFYADYYENLYINAC